MKTKVIYLEPIDNRKSFYKKCLVILHLNSKEEIIKSDLLSYKTKVASYDNKKKEVVVYGCYSATTMRHINAFLVLYDKPKMSKKEIFKHIEQRKFDKNDMVGWKSNTDFTKENKNKPAQKVIDFQKCIDGEGWEYRITNYMGWQMQHELELRS